MTKEFNQLEFLREAVRIDSSDGVEEMRDFLIETLEKHGYNPEVDEHGNTLCSRGSGEPHLVLNTHIDTVAPHLEFQETEDKIKGRGACDAKGSLAALLKSFIEAEIDGKLTLAVTPDEETTLKGSKKLDIDADAFLVGEPTDLHPCIASRGWTKVEISFEGESGHAERSENGINAIKAASEAVIALESFDDKFSHDEDMLSAPNVTATLIEGGEAENRIPADTRVTVDRRIVPPETPEIFAEKLTSHLDEEIESEAEIRVNLPEETEPLSAFKTPEDSRKVELLKKHTGNEPKVFEAATEASRFKGEIVVFGPGKLKDEKGGVAHSDREYITKSRVREAAEIAKKTVEEYL